MSRMPYSKANEEWMIAHSELTGILKLSTEWMPKAFEWQYQEIGQQPAGPDDSEWIDAYDAATFGVSWQLPAWIHESILKDAVTAFEVFLEKSREELLNWVGLTAQHQTRNHSASWSELKQFYEAIGLRIETSEVKTIRDRRHLLTHTRGELRSDKHKQLSHDPTDQWRLRLEPERLLEDLGTLDKMTKGAFDLIGKVGGFGRVTRANGSNDPLNIVLLGLMQKSAKILPVDYAG